MRIARLLTTTVAVVALVGFTSTPAMADDVQAAADGPAVRRSELQAQAEANDLSPAQARSLQAQVDQVVADTGGTQVAINQVRWDGGDTLIPLPGEARARELGIAPSAAGPHGCDYTQFCTYVNKNYTGMIDRMSSCTWHTTHGLFVSYVNNQTPGTRARLYDRNNEPAVAHHAGVLRRHHVTRLPHVLHPSLLTVVERCSRATRSRPVRSVRSPSLSPGWRRRTSPPGWSSPPSRASRGPSTASAHPCCAAGSSAESPTAWAWAPRPVDARGCGSSLRLVRGRTA